MSSSSSRKTLTYLYTGKPSRIRTAVYLYAPSPGVRRITSGAVWDTGATRSAITPYIVHELALEPVDTTIIGGAFGAVETIRVPIILELPNQVIRKPLLVSVCPFNSDPNSDTNVLIGMDIISLGDFAISNGNGQTLFSFAVPPFQEKIDFSKRDHR